MAEKNCVLLAAFWDKISIFYFGKTEHSSARNSVHSARRIALVLASFKLDTVGRQFEPYRWLSCGMTLDAVSEQLWY